VSINGKKWKLGTPFFFTHAGHDLSRKSFGTISAMYHWQDRFAETLIVLVDRYHLQSDGIQFWVGLLPDAGSTLINWSQITWRCHMSDQLRNGMPMKNVVRVSTTHPTMDGIDFDGYM
jgi:hypothetical protein